MEQNRSAKQKIIRESYVRLLMVNIFALIATNICGFIDNIMIGRFLGTQALAAVGYFSPLSVVTGLPYVVILGAVIIVGNCIGAGQQDKVNALFTSSFSAIAAAGLLFGAGIVAARNPVSALLGAREETSRMLGEYIAGYAPSFVFASLSSLLMSLASYNNEIKRSYVATAAMFFGNFLFDALLVKPLGVFGIGLASTISSLASFVILLPAFWKRSKTIHFEQGALDMGLLLQATKRGLPSMLFTAGMLVKNSLINYSLTVYIGYESIAVANVLSSVCGIAGTITGGCANSYSSLVSLYYGEEDREGFLDVYRVALRIGTAATGALVVAMMIFSGPLASVFFEKGTGVWMLARQMFRIGFLFFPLNMMLNLVMNSYKAQGRMKLVNVLSFAETAMIGLFAVLTAPRFGANAVWLANTWSDLLVLGMILVSVFLWKKRPGLRTPELLKLPEDFGASQDEYLEYSVWSLEDVGALSQSVIDFCRGRGLGERKAYLSGLCVEEIAGNVLEHGDYKAKRNHVNVRVVCKEEMTIRVQDNCRKFDPRERMDMYHPERPEKNIGLRMVAKMAKQIDYYNNAGINTLIMKI